MAPAAITSTKTPTASSGLRPSARRSSARTPPPSSNSAESTAIARSGTFSHLDLCGQHRRLGNGQPLYVRRRFDRARFLAIDRQADRYAGARAEATADRQLAAMEFDQTFHDRQTESGPIVRTIVGGAHLEERIPDAAQIVLSDADAGVFHREDQIATADFAANRNP